MKSKLLVILLFVFSISFGQEVKITKSDIFKDKKKHSYLSFALSDDNGGLVTIRSYRGGLFKKLKGYYIQYFDSNLNLIKELDYKYEGNSIRNAFIKDGKLNLIEFEHIKKEDRITMSAATANLNDLKFTKKELLTFSDDNVKQYFGFAILIPVFITNGINQADGDHLGEVIISKNKKYVAINFDFKNKEKESHKVFVFDTDFNKIYEKLIVKDIKDKLFSYNSVDIDDNDGTLYFLGKAYENKSRREKKKGKVNYHYELNKINKDGETQVNFKTSEKLINSMTLLFNDDKLTCVGFYAKKDVGRYHGVCLFDIDPKTLTIKNKKFNEFSDQFLSDKYGDRKGKKKRKKDKGIYNMDFKSLHVLSNGDVVVNAEEFFVTTYTTTNSSGFTNTRTRFHFNDIMSIRMDKEGNLKWARNINKAQTNPNNSSFTSTSIGGSSYFFINCADKIKKKKDGRLFFKQATPKKSNLYMLKIDESGEISYKKLVDDKESKVHYKVNQGEVSANGAEIILLGKKKKKTRILKLEL
ncbi:hypothetical protein [uncultured Kordia sp.]|uniref:hypothetical protein n=1 Tax=uncultured Kordia sp. TaxID=507699 RepID=UPI00260B5BD3|nr:hypothetical protein [uncultured Kordia sp.]